MMDIRLDEMMGVNDNDWAPLMDNLNQLSIFEITSQAWGLDVLVEAVGAN